MVVNDVTPAAPSFLAFSTRELTRQPGASRKLATTRAAPERLGSEIVAVPAEADLELDLLLESVMEGVLVTGTVRAQARGACVRCLDDVDLDLEVHLRELFVYPERARAAAESGDRDTDERVLDGDMVDLEPVVRDAVVLALPFQPKCRDDCPGLCPNCGARLEDDPGHSHGSPDPRWEALKGLLEREGEA
jgi:uncharacterized protein